MFFFNCIWLNFEWEVNFLIFKGVQVPLPETLFWDRIGYLVFNGSRALGVGGRTGYADDKSYGRLAHRSAGGYHNGISGKFIIVNHRGLFLHSVNDIYLQL
ncbi:hypothetical protein VNO78_24498 [Psophocarpus tetragonolobus]|uniref:Uncharacterized protein n=1 Tax=Psophocarpus tetragonolobus TaxID=3891 RepID=A0AAN9S571_PSOTE